MLGRFVIISGPDSGRELEVPAHGAELGRSSAAQLRLSDTAVSRKHCELAVEGGALYLVAIADTRINDRRVDGKQQLSEGDEVLVGQTRMIYLAPLSRGDDQAITSVTTRLGTDQVVSSPAHRGDRDSIIRRYLGALVRIERDMRDATDMEEAARRASRAMLEELAADRVGCFLPNAVGSMEAAAVEAMDGRRRYSHLALTDEIRQALSAGTGVIATNLPDKVSESIAVPLSLSMGRRGVLVCDRFAAQSATRPWDEDDLRFALCAGLVLGANFDWMRERDQIRFERETLAQRAGIDAQFIGSSREAENVRSFIAKVAPTAATVLLFGESGVGKEVVANAIHSASVRRQGPFISVNCAALQENLLESELFGHERGAFTGATERRIGRFERADGGTLFLDELGELDARCQGKLLRVLEERVFERVGGTDLIAVDVRIVAATNRNLEDAVRSGAFRQDLYYRISVVGLDIPPLRQRRADIPALAQHLLERMRGRFGRRVDGISEAALELLRGHFWPGNVRELRNAIERAGVLGSERLIVPPDLPPTLASTDGELPEDGDGGLSLAAAERRAVRRALKACSGNKSAAARALGVDRTTLYKKIAEYDLSDDGSE